MAGWWSNVAVQPFCKLLIKALLHGPDVVGHVGKLTPLQDVLGLSGTLDFEDKILHEDTLRDVGGAEVFLAEISGLILAIFRAESHVREGKALHRSRWNDGRMSERTDAMSCESTPLHSVERMNSAGKPRIRRSPLIVPAPKVSLANVWKCPTFTLFDF